MVDSLSGFGAQSYQQPISQTFQPGKNAETRTGQGQVAQDPNAQAVGAGEEAQQQQTQAIDVSSVVGDGPVENNAQAQRGSLVNITV
ncbi:MAG: hypothetical protein CL570_02675 [Alphaproteobacteria bacterium]|nr:hypothetical protein [Alphaproteobacteria bacterium]HCQ70728.1 hypothetical protein [Rhodospirillaceae bacterium]|tara:strand:+ start:43593 stop:43853 length:261 start_codon:yes stop_codon:yes gene_type:complete